MSNSRVVQIFLEAVKINALSQNEKAVADFVKSFLHNYKYEIVEDDSKKFTGSNTGNIIIKVGSGGDFLLLSHMDTARETKDLIPQIRNGKITSSGNTILGADNRAGVSVILHTLEKIYKENIPVKDFTVAFTTCEETTLFGSKYLEVNDNIKKGFVFDSQNRPGNFVNSSCGAIGFVVTIKGKAAHSGIAPEDGINALRVAVNVISKLPLGRIDEEATMNIGKLQSGAAVNVVPETAHFEGEIRSFDLQKAEEYFNFMIKFLNEECELFDATYEIKYDWDFKPYTVPEDHEVFKEISEAIRKSGLTPNSKISHGGSDANSLNGKGITSVNIGIGAQNPHANDEFIFIEDLERAAEIALNLVRKD